MAKLTSWLLGALLLSECLFLNTANAVSSFVSSGLTCHHSNIDSVAPASSLVYEVNGMRNSNSTSPLTALCPVIWSGTTNVVNTFGAGSVIHSSLQGQQRRSRR